VIPIPGTGGFQLYDEFCNLLSLLSDQQCQLVLNLTYDFQRYTYFNYPHLLINELLPRISRNLVRDADQILLLPHRPRSVTLPIAAEFTGKGRSRRRRSRGANRNPPNGQSSSADTVLYPAREWFRNHPDSAGKSVQVINAISDMRANDQNGSTRLILYLEDFLGSGQTVGRQLADYRANHRMDTDKVIVAALVAMERGLDRIIEDFCDILDDFVAARICKRGISDSTTIGDIPEALAIMTQIEDGLRIGRNFRLGFRRSEALVTMIRTPNNTFPLYWCSARADGSVWHAPFRRSL
jgi:hypothetical protein